MKKASKLNDLWESMTVNERRDNYYGVSRKFYPVFVSKLKADKKLFDEHLDLTSSIEDNESSTAVMDHLNNTIYFVGKLNMTLADGVVARVFLKYCLNGEETWWSNIRGTRGKMFYELLHTYFDEETSKERR